MSIVHRKDRLEDPQRAYLRDLRRDLREHRAVLAASPHPDATTGPPVHLRKAIAAMEAELARLT